MLKEIRKPWFMKEYEPLEELMTRLEVDASNNYKDNARKWFRQLEELWAQVEQEKVLNEKQQAYYLARMEYYRRHMKDYHH